MSQSAKTLTNSIGLLEACKIVNETFPAIYNRGHQLTGVKEINLQFSGDTVYATARIKVDEDVTRTMFIFDCLSDNPDLTQFSIGAHDSNEIQSALANVLANKGIEFTQEID